MFLRNDACRVRKWIVRVLCVVLLAAGLAGCGSGNGRASGESRGMDGTNEMQGDADETGVGADLPIRIVATVFPAYDWTREILGVQNKDAEYKNTEYKDIEYKNAEFKDVELTLLLDGGVDMHSYQPTADDIIRIATCDVFIYVGGESDQWVEKVLAAAVNPDMVVINLLDVLGDEVKEEEVVEGMESGHGHGENVESAQGREEGMWDVDDMEHEESMEQEDGWEHIIEDIFAKDEGEAEMDEHVWLSVKNAKTLCTHIASEIAKVNPVHAKKYEENVKIYLDKLDELDVVFQDTVAEGEKNTLLFADRFPFRYLTDDYGLEYFAAFPGCEAETEASFETVTFLAEKVDELELSYVLTVEGSDQRIAKTVISGTKEKNQDILVMDSMQSVTREDAENGATYLSIMKENRKVLERALSE